MSSPENSRRAWLKGAFAAAGASVLSGCNKLSETPAVRKVLAKTGWKEGEVDLFELNEAYAAQMVADNRALLWDEDRVNVNGGAIALGHPLGGTGSILITAPKSKPSFCSRSGRPARKSIRRDR